MEFVHTAIADVILIKPKVFQDERGFFLETYRKDLFAANKIDRTFVQDNHSGSTKGVLRGLHYQIRQPQGKLVRALFGEIFDVAVDLRRTSATFGKWDGAYLSAENRHQLWIPEGFAHGFLVTSERAEVAYKATDYYSPEWERVLLWNDPVLDIKWPQPDGVPFIISHKDEHGKPLKEAEIFE